MRHKYDMFQKIPGVSTIWRACVSGRYETERIMEELAEQSKIQFYAINISLINHLPRNLLEERFKLGLV